MSILELARALPTPELHRMSNGLTVCLLDNPAVEIVATGLWYRAGTRDDPAGHSGTAHFLEHMMFKGSERFGPGEIDHLTQALGGSNNAYTSHDATLYYFTFAADRWQQALAIESDRMAALTLDPEEVASERQVIVEEIAMYEGDPWSALHDQVQAELYGEHPYGRMVLGTREDLAATDAETLRDFHRGFYRPANAVLVLAGHLGEGALAAAEEAFGALNGGPAERPVLPAAHLPDRLVRLERRQGDVARLLLALPAPAADHPDHPTLQLLTTLLATGRASRLHRRLVDEDQLCVAISASTSESTGPGLLTLALEVMPGVAPERAEAALMTELERLTGFPPSAEEIERAKRVALADWVFGHEKVYQQAQLAGYALALFDLDQPRRHLEHMLATSGAEMLEIAERYLQPDRSGVLGWSLPNG